MSSIKIPYILVSQNKHKFYISKLSNKDLSEMCSTSIRNINVSKNDIYQRELSVARVKSIEAFVRRNNGIMPSAVVLNSNDRLKIENDCIVINKSKDTFFIIDGQHRIFGAKNATAPYEFPVIIFDSIEKNLQAELFISINNEQKKVNSNVRYAVMANDSVKTPEKVLYNIASILNDKKTSPFYRIMRMSDKRFEYGVLSVSTFISALINYIYKPKDYYILKEKLEEAGVTNELSNYFKNHSSIFKNYSEKFLWRFYSNDKEDIIYKLIFNYFGVIKKIFINSWNSDTILYKTTGFNALALLFKDISLICIRDKDLSYGKICGLLKPLEKTNIDFSVRKWGLGKIASKNLYLYLISELDLKYGNFDYDAYNSFEDG